MKLPKNFKQVTSKILSHLKTAGYEISQATGVWHIHKGNIYCGNLQYKGAKGWQGSALRHLPGELLEQLQEITH
jgi:hypothetical protein